MEDWQTAKDLITPNNLIKFGNPPYTILAACLGLLEAYNNGPALAQDHATKVCKTKYIKISKIQAANLRNIYLKSSTLGNFKTFTILLNSSTGY